MLILLAASFTRRPAGLGCRFSGVFPLEPALITGYCRKRLADVLATRI